MKTNRKLTNRQQAQEDVYVLPYHYLDLLTEEYKYVWSIGHLSYLSIVKKLLGNIKGKKVLDAGCGDGRLCFELKEIGAEITGVDFSERALDFARVFSPNVSFVNTDLKTLALQKKFDIVILMEVLEHLIPKERDNVIKNIANLLKPGGKLVVTVPTTNVPMPEKHYEHFTRETLSNVWSESFDMQEVVGHERMGWRYKVYFLLQVVTLSVLPFAHHWPNLKVIYNWLKKYYQSNIEICLPEKAGRLIGVFEKKV